MSEQYLHLLIPRSKFTPSAAQISEFLTQLINSGVLSTEPKIVLSTRSEATRTVTNPFTGEPLMIPCFDTRELPHLSALESAAGELLDYTVFASSYWKPRLPPVPISFDDAYSISASCHVSSLVRSTSNLPSDRRPRPGMPGFWAPCEADLADAYFMSPHDGSILTVSGVGCARFYVEFELGKWLFPDLSTGSLEIINPKVLRLAEDLFGVRFGQGCRTF
jgi:hypothetical protein